MTPNLKYEKNLYAKNYSLVCGVDEVGKGAWAGPLIVAAIILRKDKRTYKVRDSKDLNQEKREKILPKILKNAIDFSIGEVSAKEIDLLGLSNATILAGERCIKGLSITPDIALLDGNWNYLKNSINAQTIIKGDKKSLSIASASIIAKVTRDRLLTIYHKIFPEYKFYSNKGYGSVDHKKAIERFGLIDIHRKSYKISIL